MIARRIVTIVALVGLSTLVGCEEEGGGCSKGGTIWYAPYKLEMPDGWTQVKETPYDLQYLSPEEGEGDTFREYVRVSYATPPGRANANELASNFFMHHAEEFPERTEVAEERTRVAGKEAHRIVFTYRDGESARKAVGWFVIYKATGLAVIGVATPESFDRYLPVFERTAGTLKLE